MSNSLEVENILDEARESISTFCVSECQAYCCRKGYLVLTPAQSVATLGMREEEYLERGLLKRMSDGNWSLYMGSLGFPCPSLSDNKCRVHNNSLRADACHVFPISVTDGFIHVSRRCPAKNNQLLYPFFARLVQLGCKVEE